MQRLNWLAITILLYLPVAGQFSSLAFDRLGSANGLSYDKVRTILQDRRGFIWIGTLNGLNRYDGHRFKIFLSNFGDSTTIPDNRIQRLFEDSKGNLWVCTLSGISLYDPVREQFINFSSINADGSKAYHTCYDIIEHNNEYWVATVRGIWRLNLQSHTLDMFPGKPANDPVNSRVFYALTSFGDKIFAGSFQGLLQIDPVKKNYDSIQLNDGNPAHNRANNSITFLKSLNDHIWISTWSGGLKKFDPSTRTFSTYLFSNKSSYAMTHNIVRYIVPSSQNKECLWISSAGEGLHRFNMRTGTFESWYSTQDNDRYSIPAGGSFCVMEDRQHRLWAGGDKGVYMSDPSKQLILQKKPYWALAENCNSEIVSIYKDPAAHGNYYVSNWTCGLFRTDSSFTQNFPLPALLKKINDLSSAYRPVVLSWLRDRKGYLWMAAGSRGLFCIDEEKNAIRHWGMAIPGINNADSLQGKHFRGFLQDNRNRIWIGSSAGLCYYDTALKTIRVIDHPLLGHQPITDLTIDSKGNLWIISSCSDQKEPLLHRVNIHTGKITSFRNAVMDRLTCISQQVLFQVFIDRHDRLWISSAIGLIQMNITGDTATTVLFDPKNGLPSSLCNELLPYDPSHIWIATSHGLCLFNIDALQVEKKLSARDGLLLTDLDGQHFYQDNDQLFISGLDGQYNVLEKMVLPTAGAPAVVLTGIRLLNKNFLPGNKPIADLTELHISYKQNNLQFEFAALDYTHPEQQQYAYRLEGLEEEWVYTREPVAVYNNLSGGKYLFRVKAANSDGQWNEEGISLKLIVQPPFWQTLWFRILLIAVIGILIYLFYRRRMKAVIRESEFKQAKAEAETKALRAQMNPHFIFNCMNTIDAYILKNKQEEASNILQKFSGLMRIVLNNSRFNKIPLEEEVRALELYIELEKYILEKSFTHTFVIQSELLKKPYAVPPLLIQPYVENAILHGLRHKETCERILTINMKLQDDNICCVIEDNGIGRKRSAAMQQEHTYKKSSLGLQVTKERIDQLNSQQESKISIAIDDIEEDDKTGTKVTILFPVELMEPNQSA